MLDWPPIEYYRQIAGQVRTRSDNIVHLVDYFEEMENIDRGRSRYANRQTSMRQNVVWNVHNKEKTHTKYSTGLIIPCGIVCFFSLSVVSATPDSLFHRVFN